MRFYSFSNMYLSSIQVGLQSAHVISDMFVKYNIEFHQEKPEILYDWAENHKTMILLNGGYSDNIRNLVVDLDNPENPYPWAAFCESDDALDGALTCAGIILPEKIYTAAALARKNRVTTREGGKVVDHEIVGGVVVSYATIDEINQTGQLVVAPEDNESGEEVVWEFTRWEAKFINKLNTFGMAK